MRAVRTKMHVSGTLNPRYPIDQDGKQSYVQLFLGRDRTGWFFAIEGEHPLAGTYRVFDEAQGYDYVAFASLALRRERRQRLLAELPAWTQRCKHVDCDATFSSSELEAHVAPCCELSYCAGHLANHISAGCPKRCFTYVW